MYGQSGNSNLDFTWDKDYGAVKANPWRVLPSAGFHVLQIDTRPGLTRKPKTDSEPDRSGLNVGNAS